MPDVVSLPDVVTLFDRALHHFGQKVAEIGERWEGPTPDAEWDVRALVNHVVVEDLWVRPLLAGRTIADIGDSLDGDRLGDDPAAAWEAAKEMAMAAAGEVGVTERIVHLSFGDFPGAVYLSQIVVDHVIHGWDLARAIGADQVMDPELLAFVEDFVTPQAEDWRSAGAFGPKVEVPAGSDRQTRLLALTGRRS